MARWIPLLAGFLCGSFFLLILLGIGIFLIVGNLRARKKADASQNWPATSGTVVLSEVRKSETHNEEGGLSSIAYFPYVEYDYQVNDQMVRGKKLTFGGHDLTKSYAEATARVAKYPVGAAVSVYYNPGKLEDAVLERAAPRSKSGLIVGIILTSLGGIGLLVLLITALFNFAS